MEFVELPNCGYIRKDAICAVSPYSETTIVTKEVWDDLLDTNITRSIPVETKGTIIVLDNGTKYVIPNHTPEDIFLSIGK